MRRSVPSRHVDFLRGLKPRYERNGLLVTHSSGDADNSNSSNAFTFHVFGHTPRGQTPIITENWAAIDTGCGTYPEGRLTCLVWPTLEIMQVDHKGRVVQSEST